MARYLLIVARDQPDLHEHLAQEFLGDPHVEVLPDRREHNQAHEPERRRTDRGPQRRIDDRLRTLGVVVAHQQQEAPSD